MKTTEEIKTALRQCNIRGDCRKCAYFNDGCELRIELGDTELTADALAYIEQLETKEVKAQYVSTCPRCAEVIDGDPRYCPHCGQRVQRIVVGGGGD